MPKKTSDIEKERDKLQKQIEKNVEPSILEQIKLLNEMHDLAEESETKYIVSSEGAV